MQNTFSPVWWNRLKLLTKLLLGSGLIIFLFASGKLDVATILSSYTSPASLTAGTLCCTAGFGISVLRWWILSKIQSLPLRGADALRLTMISYFFSIFVPGASGGDVVRAVYAVRECSEKKAHAITVAFADRGLGVHALLLLAGAAFCVQPGLLDAVAGLRPWMPVVTGLFIAGMLAPVFLLWERTNGPLIKLCGRVAGGADAWRDALRRYCRSPGMLCLAYLCSIGNVVFNVLMIHYMMRAVGATPAILESLAIAPLVILANTLPLTPGGIGLAEAASAGLYDLAGRAGGANGMLLTRFVIVCHALTGVFFFLAGRRSPVAGKRST